MLKMVLDDVRTEEMHETLTKWIKTYLTEQLHWTCCPICDAYRRWCNNQHIDEDRRTCGNCCLSYTGYCNGWATSSTLHYKYYIRRTKPISEWILAIHNFIMWFDLEIEYREFELDKEMGLS